MSIIQVSIFPNSWVAGNADFKVALKNGNSWMSLPLLGCNVINGNGIQLSKQKKTTQKILYCLINVNSTDIPILLQVAKNTHNCLDRLACS